MPLSTYIADTRRLLQNPAAATALIYSDPDLTNYINRARIQIAGREKCIRALGILNTTIDQRIYPFGIFDTGPGLVTGIASVLNIRRINYTVGSGQKQLTSRPWEWFDYYLLANPVPVSGEPREWAQFTQGVAGQAYLDPPPDAAYQLIADCECYPNNLVSDGSVEAIPPLWLEAIPFFAARLALLSSQTGAREKEAERMMERYNEFAKSAREAATPDVLPWQYERAPDEVQLMKVAGMKGGG